MFYSKDFRKKIRFSWKTLIKHRFIEFYTLFRHIWPQIIHFWPPRGDPPRDPPPGGGGDRGGDFREPRCTDPSEKIPEKTDNFTEMIQKPNFHQNFTGPGILINVFSGWDGHPPFSPNSPEKAGISPPRAGVFSPPQGNLDRKIHFGRLPTRFRTRKHISVSLETKKAFSFTLQLRSAMLKAFAATTGDSKVSSDME